MDLLLKKFNWQIDLIILSVALGILFFSILGIRPLFTPDEGRYAEIAREMVVSGNYSVPFLNGVPYLEKPVLFYWLAALAIKLFGLHVASLRSVNAGLALLLCLMTYFVARKLYDRVCAFLAAFILATNLLFFVMANMISLDLTVTFFITASLFIFLLGSQATAINQRNIYFNLATVAAALAVLTKGLMGIVFPSAVTILWLVFYKQFYLVSKKQLLTCILIFLILTLPWHVFIALSHPDFLNFYFLRHHFLRFVTPNVDHAEPIWFFIPYGLLGFFPWVVFLPQAFTSCFLKNTVEKPKDAFFIFWVLFIFIFFSLSKSKLIPYILPIFPALAILVGRYLGAYASLRGLKSGAWLLWIISLSITCLAYFSQFSIFAQPHLAKIYLFSAALLLFIGSSLSLIAFHYLYHIKAYIVLIISAAFCLLMAVSAVPFIDTRTVLPLVKILKPILRPEDDVIVFNQYYQDLPFYLERRITILNWRNEFLYGMRYQNTQEWLIDNTLFWQRWYSKRRIFVILSINEYKLLLYKHASLSPFLLGETKTTALISNQKFPA